MSTQMKKFFFLVIPLMAVFLVTPSAFAKKKHKHCKPRYDQSYYDRYGYDRPYYDRGRYNDRHYDRYENDDYDRRRTYSRPRYNDGYYGGGSYYPNSGYYGGSSYPPTGNIPWWDILLPRY